MQEGMGNAELILLIESRLSEKGAHIFKQAVKANDYNAFQALGGLSDAYAKQGQAISAGYSRRQS